jgi:hypothetical protein
MERARIPRKKIGWLNSHRVDMKLPSSVVLHKKFCSMELRWLEPYWRLFSVPLLLVLQHNFTNRSVASMERGREN